MCLFTIRSIRQLGLECDLIKVIMKKKLHINMTEELVL